MKSGTKRENLACDMLQEKHCRICSSKDIDVWAPLQASFGKQGKYRTTDIFNKFDVISSCEHLIRFIQLKSENSRRSKVIKSLKEFKFPVTSNISIEYWTHFKVNQFNKYLAWYQNQEFDQQSLIYYF